MARAKRSSTDAAGDLGGRSLERARRLPGAVELSIYEDHPHLRSLKRQYGLEPAASLKTLAAEMADPAQVRAHLEQTSALGLIALELVVEAGGVLWYEQLEALWRERVGGGGEAAHEGALSFVLEGMEQRGLVVSVRMSLVRRRVPERAAALLEPNALAVADAVYGVTLPAWPGEGRAGDGAPQSEPPQSEPPSSEPPSSEPPSSEPPSSEPQPPASPSPELARCVAVATLTAHHKVRATMAGWVHRGSIKKHARRLEMDPKVLEELLEQASRGGAVRAADGRFHVDLEGLDRLARGGASQAPRSLVAWLRAEGPLSREELVRRLARLNYVPISLSVEGLRDARAEAAALVDQLGPGLSLEVNGARWYRVADDPGPLPEGPVGGFVTPSLDVMVGPDPDPRLIAQVGLGAELVRLDRVITFRLRPQTVADLVRVGGEPDRLIEALDKIGKHGLPDSVRAQILDWATAPKLAVARSVVLVHAPERHHDALAEVLAARSLGSPRPGELLLSTDDYLALRSELESAGFELSDALVREPSPGDGVDEEDDDLFDAELLGVLPRAAPLASLRERVRRERAEGFAESWRELSRLSPEPAQLPSPAAMRARLAEAVPRGFPAVGRRAVKALIKLHERLFPRLEEWANNLPPDARTTALVHVSDPAMCFGLLSITPRKREQLLNATNADNMFDIFDQSVELLRANEFSAEGRRVRNALSNPQFVRWLNELVAERADAIEAGDLFGVDAPGRARHSAPSPAASPSLDPEECLTLLQIAIVAKALLVVSWRAPEGVRRESVWVDQITERGGRTLALLVEERGERGRAVPVDDILSVQIADPFG